jgi:hypothetical protein
MALAQRVTCTATLLPRENHIIYHEFRKSDHGVRDGYVYSWCSHWRLNRKYACCFYISSDPKCQLILGLLTSMSDSPRSRKITLVFVNYWGVRC